VFLAFQDLLKTEKHVQRIVSAKIQKKNEPAKLFDKIIGKKISRAGESFPKLFLKY